MVLAPSPTLEYTCVDASHMSPAGIGAATAACSSCAVTCARATGCGPNCQPK